MEEIAMQEFLPEVTLLQTEPAVPVRKQLVEFLEAAVQHARPSLAALTSVLSTLARLLDDSAPAVVKRAISACSVAFRRAHIRLAPAAHGITGQCTLSCKLFINLFVFIQGQSIKCCVHWDGILAGPGTRRRWH